MADGNPDTGRALLGPERDPGRRWSEHILPFETLDQSYLEQFRNVGESHPRRKKIKSKLRELKKWISSTYNIGKEYLFSN